MDGPCTLDHDRNEIRWAIAEVEDQFSYFSEDSEYDELVAAMAAYCPGCWKAVFLEEARRGRDWDALERAFVRAERATRTRAVAEDADRRSDQAARQAAGSWKAGTGRGRTAAYICRHLIGAELETPEAFWAGVKQFCELIQTPFDANFEAIVSDIQAKTRWPTGEDLWAKAVEEFELNDSPYDLEDFPSEAHWKLMGVCYHLQELAGGRAFFISHKRAAEFLGRSKTTVYEIVKHLRGRDRYLEGKPCLAALNNGFFSRRTGKARRFVIRRAAEDGVEVPA